MFENQLNTQHESSDEYSLRLSLAETAVVRARIRYAAFNPTTAVQAADMKRAGRNPNATSRWIRLNIDPSPVTHVLEAIFEATNLQAGDLWDQIQPLLPTDRTHTSLSCEVLGGGDEIDVYLPANRRVRTYRCDSNGWSYRDDSGRFWRALSTSTREDEPRHPLDQTVATLIEGISA
jgi:hypothetical protein